ncbi:unnamed protein product, partial [Hapterophycus canaliculatus]
MGRQALALPKAEPLLHMPITSIVELVSNRSEAEVLFRIGDLAHEFDHLTAVLVQWLEHQQVCIRDRVQCGVEHQQPVQDAGDSPLLSSRGQQARGQGAAAEDHGVPAAAAEAHGEKCRPSLRQPERLLLSRAAPLRHPAPRRAA